MSLDPGARIGPYEITGVLGAGGMGEVYRARDSKLNRDVALKILPESFAADADRVARFRREAQVLASLNDPGIAAIYGFEDSGSTHALVLELVEGPTLQDRIARGPLLIDEALPIARKIADALRAAHEQGVIHRDLKPANIKLRPDGAVKVLDFGLAKAMDPMSAISPDFSMAPTITTPAQMTGVGMILGTAAYMSPEQAKGRPADKRSDVWAFGAVLFEMLTGRRAFEGEDVSDTLASVLKSEPEWVALPTNVPPALVTVLRRSLEKDRNKRLTDISAVLFVMDEPTMSGVMRVPATAVAAAPGAAGGRAGWLVAAALLLALAALGASIYFRRAEEPPSIRFGVLPPEGWSVTFNGGATAAQGASPAPLAVSPDGRRIAFLANTPTGRSRLWVRSLDALTAQELPGTEGASGPFWSPDSRSIGFFADNRIRRIDLAGGPPLTICESRDYRGGTWSQDGVILFAAGSGGPLQKVAASGGVPVAATVVAAGQRGHGRPTFLPDGRHFAFVEYAGPSVQIGSLDSPDVKLLFDKPGTINVAFLRDRMIFMRETTLMAQSFDMRSLALTGEPVPIAEDVQALGTPASGLFSTSLNGVLVYQTSTLGNGAILTWYDRTGKMLGALGEPAQYGDLEISPDGTRAAVTVALSTGNRDIWVVDLVRGGIRTRVTSDPANDMSPVWSPDGTTLAFDSDRTNGRGYLYKRAASGVGNDEILLESPSGARTFSWVGEWVLYQQIRGALGSTDLWALPLAGERKPFKFGESQFARIRAKLSPDGRWASYESNESGSRPEIYVAPFPKGDTKYLISTAGGTYARWRRDGKEMFYLDGTGQLTAVAVDGSGPTLKVGTPKPLFPINAGATRYSYDLSPDGQRVLVLSGRAPSQQPMTVVANWTAGLKK